MIIEAIAGSLVYRIRGGMGNEAIRNYSGKPKGWEIPNGIIRGIWALYVTILIGANSPYLGLPIIFVLAFLGVVPGYFGGEFDLTKKENRTWQNLSLLSARGAFIILPLALCFSTLYPHLWYGVACGALMPIWYLLGVEIGKKSAIMSHSQWGEVLIGASIGACL